MRTVHRRWIIDDVMTHPRMRVIEWLKRNTWFSTSVRTCDLDEGVLDLSPTWSGPTTTSGQDVSDGSVHGCLGECATVRSETLMWEGRVWLGTVSPGIAGRNGNVVYWATLQNMAWRTLGVIQ